MINRINNFDLIRLLAAFQVVIAHGIIHLKINNPLSSLSYILNYFPGVIVFFTISGFLITSSLQRNINIKTEIRKSFFFFLLGTNYLKAVVL